MNRSGTCVTCGCRMYHHQERINGTFRGDRQHNWGPCHATLSPYCVEPEVKCTCQAYVAHPALAVDLIGQEIKVGSYIVYGQALGRCAGLNFAKVVSVKALPESRSWKQDDDPDEYEYRIGVMGSGNIKVSTLMFPERCCVVDVDKVDPKMVKEIEDLIIEAAKPKPKKKKVVKVIQSVVPPVKDLSSMW